MNVVKMPRIVQAADIQAGETAFYEALGLVLRDRRKGLKMDMEDVAAGASVGFRQIQKYEYGANKVSLHNLLLICLEMGVDVGVMFGFEPLSWHEYATGEPESAGDTSLALGGMLRKRRRFLELTQRQVADRAGLTHQQINKFETGRPIPVYRLFQVSAALELSHKDGLNLAVRSFEGHGKPVSGPVVATKLAIGR